MAQIIKLKRSSTATAEPTLAQLALGEVAINTYDGKMYIKKDDGTASIVEIGAGGGGSSSTTYVKTTVTATANQTTVTGLTYTAGLVDVYLNGVKLVVGTDVTATNGTSIILASGATVNDIIQIVAFAATGSMRQHIIKADGGSATTAYTSAQSINGGTASG
tara:strand:+ start:1553 stop:2038 length:486 start_codon:yes stop_codon:yes gene_type:complete